MRMRQHDRRAHRKLATRKCPKCGNTVIYDQSKGEKALCPVCHEPINTTALQLKTVEFSCAQCGIQLHASKADPVCVCPVCGCENNVEQRAVTEKIKRTALPASSNTRATTKHSSGSTRSRTLTSVRS